MICENAYPRSENAAALISNPKMRSPDCRVPTCHHHSVGAPRCKYWSAGMKIADFDAGIGTGAPDVDAAISGVACSPRSKRLMVMLLLTLKKCIRRESSPPHILIARWICNRGAPWRQRGLVGMFVS